MAKKLAEYIKNPGFANMQALAIILFVAILGTVLIVASHADTPNPSTSISASSGTLGGGASLQTCPGSSSSQVVKFGQTVPMDCNVALALTQPGTPFAANSFWNTLLPDSAGTGSTANPNSAAYASYISGLLVNNPAGLGYAQGTSQYSAPLYVVPANQPYVSMTRVCNGTVSPNVAFTASFTYADGTYAGGTSGVPIPNDAQAASGTDGEIQIYQPSTDRYWEFYRFAKDTTTGGWEACWGGSIAGETLDIGGHNVTEPTVSQSDGTIPDGLGAMATGLPMLGSVVRIEELEKGEIDHVMGLELANNLCPYVIGSGVTSCPAISSQPPPTFSSTPFSWPASRTDGKNINPQAVPEGQRFRLPINLDLSQYHLSPVAMAIAVAAQKYGFVVDDTVGSVQVRTGDPAPYINAGLGNPYTSGPGVGGTNDGNQGLFDGTIPFYVMQNFPWSQLQALPFDYGQPD